jgi:hypothetical protein
MRRGDAAQGFAIFARGFLLDWVMICGNDGETGLGRYYAHTACAFEGIGAIQSYEGLGASRDAGVLGCVGRSFARFDGPCDKAVNNPTI